MDISLDDSLETSDNPSTCLTAGNQDGSDLMHGTDLNDTLRVSVNSSQISGSRPRSIDDYTFTTNAREQLPYKLVQMANNNSSNSQPGLNFIPSDFQSFLSSPGASVNNDSVQIPISSFSNSNSVTSSSASVQQAARLAYISNPNRTSTSEESTSSQSDQACGQGQFYLLMSPQDMLTSHASKYAQRNTFEQTKTDDGRVNSTRRVQHNEVERRRRDKINTWIMKLASIVPSCASDQSKQGQSKGGILAKACDYINDLQSTARQCEGIEKKIERLQYQLRAARIELKDQKQENEILHQTLRDHGFTVDVTGRGNT